MKTRTKHFVIFQKLFNFHGNRELNHVNQLEKKTTKRKCQFNCFNLVRKLFQWISNDISKTLSILLVRFKLHLLSNCSLIQIRIKWFSTEPTNFCVSFDRKSASEFGSVALFPMIKTVVPTTPMEPKQVEKAQQQQWKTTTSVSRKFQRVDARNKQVFLCKFNNKVEWAMK